MLILSGKAAQQIMAQNERCRVPERVDVYISQCCKRACKHTLTQLRQRDGVCGGEPFPSSSGWADTDCQSICPSRPSLIQRQCWSIGTFHCVRRESSSDLFSVHPPVIQSLIQAPIQPEYIYTHTHTHTHIHTHTQHTHTHTHTCTRTQ